MTTQNTIFKFEPSMVDTLDKNSLYHLRTDSRILLGLTVDELAKNYDPHRTNYVGFAAKR